MRWPTYPAATPGDIVDDLHGHLVPDPYRWLEDPTSPLAQEWSSAQDTLWVSHRDALPGQASLRKRLEQLLERRLRLRPRLARRSSVRRPAHRRAGARRSCS